LITNGRIRVSDLLLSDLLHSDVINEKSMVPALAQKNVRTIDKDCFSQGPSLPSVILPVQ